MALIKLNTRSIPDAAVTPAKVSQNLGRRNMFRNGDMQIWQRGTTVTGAGSVTADGWYAYSTDSGTANYGVVVTRQETSPLGEYGYYAQVAQSGTQTGINYLTFGQRIESAITKSQLTAGDKVTFSCYIRRKQDAASNLTVHVRYPSGGVDNYQSGQTLLSQYDTTIASPYQVSFNSLAINTWVRITATFDASSAMANRGCAVFLENGSADLGVSNTNPLYDTTGWQLEKGDTATAYEHLTYAEELSLCKRYFQRISGLRQGAYSPCMIAYSTSAVQGTLHFQTPMFSTPSITLEGAGMKMEDGGNAYTTSATSVSGQKGSENHLNWWIGGFSGLTDGNAYYCYGDDANHYIDLSAEL